MNEDIVAFLEARLAEDEAFARYAATDGSGHWEVHESEATSSRVIDRAADMTIVNGSVTTISEAEHIAHHDPARVLREIEAKRAILAIHTPDELDDTTWCTACWSEDRDEFEWLWPCATVRALAAPYVDDAVGRDRALLHEIAERLASDTGERHTHDEAIERFGFVREELEAEIDREEADRIAWDMALEGSPLTDEARAAVLRRVVAERKRRAPHTQPEQGSNRDGAGDD